MCLPIRHGTLLKEVITPSLNGLSQTSHFHLIESQLLILTPTTHACKPSILWHNVKACSKIKLPKGTCKGEAHLEPLAAAFSMHVAALNTGVVLCLFLPVPLPAFHSTLPKVLCRSNDTSCSSI